MLFDINAYMKNGAFGHQSNQDNCITIPLAFGIYCLISYFYISSIILQKIQ